MDALPGGYPHDVVVAFVLNVLVQSSLIAAAALVVGRSLTRSPVVRHWTLLSALVCLSLSPLMVVVVEQSGLSLLSIRLPRETASDPQVAVSVDRSTDLDVIPPAAYENFDPPRWEYSPTLVDDISADPPPGDEPSQSPSPAPAMSRDQIARRCVGVGLVVWGIVSLVLCLGIVGSWWKLRSVRRGVRPVDTDAIGDVLHTVRRALGVADLPKIVTSPKVDCPVSVGAPTPLVIFPVGLIVRLSPAQLRDVLVHEVAHVLRRDHVVVLLQNIVAAVFWPHPLVHWLNRHLTRAREEVCDNYVLGASDRLTYSETLVRIAELIPPARAQSSSAAFLTADWKLKDRVSQLLDERRKTTTRLNRLAALAISGVFLLMSVTAAGSIEMPGQDEAAIVDGRAVGPDENDPAGNATGHDGDLASPGEPPSTQVFIGPNSKGGFNAYMLNPKLQIWHDAYVEARDLTFPGYLGGVVPTRDMKGHLVTLQGKGEADFIEQIRGKVVNTWIGLTDNASEFAHLNAFEAGDTSGDPDPPLKPGSTYLRQVPRRGERGAGWVWITGEPLQYQTWLPNQPNDDHNGPGEFPDRAPANLRAGDVHEDVVSIRPSGMWNDTNTWWIAEPLPGNRSIIEWELNLPEHPLEIRAQLASLPNGKLGGKAVARVRSSGQTVPAVKWTIRKTVTNDVSPADSQYAPGLATEWFMDSLWISSLDWSTRAPPSGEYRQPTQPILPLFRVAKISFGNELGGNYPPETGFGPVVKPYFWKSFSVRFRGEIFIPRAGEYTFRDHNDDYARLTIDGDVLIDDGVTTNWSGEAYPHTNVGTKAFAAAGWYPIEFLASQHWERNAIRLLWDYTGPMQDEETDEPSVGHPRFNTIAPGFFRGKRPAAQLTQTVVALSGEGAVGTFAEDGQFGDFTLANPDEIADWSLVVTAVGSARQARNH